MNFFTNKYFDGVNYSDFSMKLKDYGTPSVQFTLATTNYFYIGNYKPFNNMFLEFENANINPNELSAEYFNGVSWVALEVLDESNGFTESGFINFNKPENWGAIEIDNDTRFYVRIKPSVDQSQIDLKGLGILFSNDMDLIAQRSNIVSKHNNGSSWVLKQEESRKEIIGLLRRNGHVKVKEKNNSNENAQLFFGDGKNDLLYIDLTEFDIIDIEQLREASKYKTLELIYLNELSDENDDKYMRQGRRYGKKFSDAMNLFYLKLDLNDDGITDDNENNHTTETVLFWQ